MMFYSELKMAVSLTLVLLALLAITTTSASSTRPRGVSLAYASLYQPTHDKNWVCLDGIRTIPYDRINDDYCDCDDGSDEPGTAACSNGHFHCTNQGHIPQDIPSSRVDDGICDCCDGSDEIVENNGKKCKNNCHELGRAEELKRKVEADLHMRGAAKRDELITKGKQMQSERTARRAELETQRSEQEALKAEKENIKRDAEAAEADALEIYKEQQRELDAAAAEEAKLAEEPHNLRMEAEANFVRYDTNKDGFVEVTELQIDMTLDRDRNGVVTVDEAKYFLDERDRIDFDGFLALSWPRIKPVQMLAQGLFRPPFAEETEEAELHQDEKVEQPEHTTDNNKETHNTEDADAEEEETYEDEEEDVGVGSVTPENKQEYDPETQRLVDIAQEARNAFDEVDRNLREIDREIKDIDDQNAKDYGPNEEYATMDGECYSFEDREYVYTLCPFDRASQKSRSGGSETTLGRWDQWYGDENNKYSKQRYAHGASCWNGPQRSAVVHLKCALEPAIRSVTEPNRCEYFFDLETPAACDHEAFIAAEKDRHDEL
ncbi:glucosidase 2 subunit beta [Teleopsis dalmanni]|uniref:glucosidase 2 subunit beta n=1 Tax=Teleopsis dalmanni TaxID=139649 RepID=UPI0018CDA78B|nr:glucosidase 2 subunit beta [Teleopsis dalmanni]